MQWVGSGRAAHLPHPHLDKWIGKQGLVWLDVAACCETSDRGRPRNDTRCDRTIPLTPSMAGGQDVHSHREHLSRRWCTRCAGVLSDAQIVAEGSATSVERVTGRLHQAALAASLRDVPLRAITCPPCTMPSRMNPAQLPGRFACPSAPCSKFLRHCAVQRRSAQRTCTRQFNAERVADCRPAWHVVLRAGTPQAQDCQGSKGLGSPGE